MHGDIFCMHNLGPYAQTTLQLTESDLATGPSDGVCKSATHKAAFTQCWH